jgi:Tol biopolymer transport system component
LQIAETGDASPVEAQIVAQSVTSGERKILVPTGSAPRYVPSGHLLYARDGIVFARRFDLERLEPISEETPVVEGVGRPTFVGASTSVAYFDVSTSGSLVYIPGPITRMIQYDLGVLDPQKGIEPLKLQPRAYRYPRVSHDGKWIAVEATDGQSEDIWIYERSRSSAMRRLTSSGRNRYPLWSSDSTFVAFQSERDGNRGLFRQRADGSGTAERLTTPDPETSHVPNSWSRDGHTLFYEVVSDAASARELWALTLPDKTRMRVGEIQAASLSTVEATLSPNGRWLAYRSSVNGAPAVSVQPFPATGGSITIAETAVHPVWSTDGRTLFFNRMSTGEFFATTVTSESPFQFSTPRQLSGISSERESNSSPSNHDITPEGTFIGVIAAERGDNALKPQINIVLNWVEELRRILPAK